MHDCGNLLEAIERYIAKADDDLEDVLSEEGFIEPKLTVKKASEIEDAITEILEEETELFITSAETAFDVQSFADRIWPGVQLDDQTAEKITEIFKEKFEELLPELIEPYLKHTDNALNFTSVTKKTTAWILNWSTELGALMKLTSHTELENIMKKNLEAGNGIQDFILDIQNSGIRDERYRARRVAITESLRAHSVAQEEAIQQSPAVESKEWVHTGSYRNSPRPNHEAISGQIVPKTDPFTLYGADGSTYYPQYPRDPILPASESVNCHCIHRGIVSEQILGLPLAERRRLQSEAIAEMDAAWEEEFNAQNKAKAGIEE